MSAQYREKINQIFATQANLLSNQEKSESWPYVRLIPDSKHIHDNSDSIFNGSSAISNVEIHSNPRDELIDGSDTAYSTANISWLEQFNNIFFEYVERINVLKEYAELDEIDELMLNSASEESLFEFIGKYPYMKRGHLVLMDNGNLRAVWRNQNADQLGLQFLSKDSVQYVIFKKRKSSDAVSRVSGQDTMKGIMRQIDSFDLHDVLYHDW